MEKLYLYSKSKSHGKCPVCKTMLIQREEGCWYCEKCGAVVGLFILICGKHLAEVKGALLLEVKDGITVLCKGCGKACEFLGDDKKLVNR